MKRFLWIPVAFLLSSCASDPLFIEPADGDRARVRLVEGVSVYAVPGKDCIDKRMPGAGYVLKSARGRSLGMPPGLTSKATKAEFYVEAGNPISLVVEGAGVFMGYETVCPPTYDLNCSLDGNNCEWVEGVSDCFDAAVYKSCSTAVSFVPEKDVDYEAVYSEESVYSCNVDVYPIGVHQGEVVRVNAPEKSCIVKGRESTYFLPIQDAFETSEAKKKLGGNVKFYFADQPHPDVDAKATLIQNFVVYKRDRDRSSEKSIEKKEEQGCNRALVSILLAFQRYALKIGGNAVINIESYYKENPFRSNDQFECHAGLSVSHVVLKGDIVKLK
jgi:hypothetical protein